MRLRKGEEEPKPEATPQTVVRGLSRLGKTASGIKQTYLDLKVTGTLMADASLVAKYVNLQSVEVPSNEITDLSSLSSLKHLTHLDASHNKLTEAVALEPPTRNLRSLYLSHNSISAVRNLSGYQRLSRLVLDENQITDLSGLGSLPNLRVLSVQNNKLASLEGLQKLPGLRELVLNGNSIPSLEPLASLSKLMALQVTNNKLASLKGVEGIASLIRVDCSDNLITELEGLTYARGLPLLKELTIAGNAIATFKLARVHVVHLLPQLEILNSEEVTFVEKVQASNLHGADAAPLKTIRKKHFPDGELDDGGGAVIPLSAGLLASNGLDAKDDEVHFEAADETARTLSQDLLLEGVDKFGDFLIRKHPSQLALARVCWTWLITNAADPPSVPWQVGLPALCPSMAAVEETLLPHAGEGTYAERLAGLFTMLCRACQLEVNDVLGFWKHDTMLPGSRLETHNHCWNAIKLNGRWRLLDLFWAVRSVREGVATPFYVSPEAFIYSHLPLEEWWQLLGTYLSAEQFWDLPFCTLTFFTKGLYFTNDDLSAVATVDVGPYLEAPRGEFPTLPVVELLLEHPHGELVYHELLDGDLNPLHPEKQPGSFVFTQLCTRTTGGAMAAGHDALVKKGCVAQKLWTSFPGPGDYFVRISLVNGTQVMMLRYVLPEGVAGEPVCFPLQAPEFVRTGCELVSPLTTTVLQGDMSYDWQVYAPGATKMEIGDDDAATGFWQQLPEASAAFFSGSVPIPRTAQARLKATFKPGKEVTLLTYSVRPPVQRLDPLPAGPAPMSPAPAGKLAAGRAAFLAMDSDHDGLISRAQLAVGLLTRPELGPLLGLPAEALSSSPQGAALEEAVRAVASDASGKISWPQLAASIESVGAAEPGLVSLECSAELDGSLRVTLSELQLPRGDEEASPQLVALECSTSELDGSVKVALSAVAEMP